MWPNHSQNVPSLMVSSGPRRILEWWKDFSLVVGRSPFLPLTNSQWNIISLNSDSIKCSLFESTYFCSFVSFCSAFQGVYTSSKILHNVLKHDFLLLFNQLVSFRIESFGDSRPSHCDALICIPARLWMLRTRWICRLPLLMPFAPFLIYGKTTIN